MTYHTETTLELARGDEHFTLGYLIGSVKAALGNLNRGNTTALREDLETAVAVYNAYQSEES